MSSNNATLAQTTLIHLAQLGVRELCVAAGARNTPLVTAILASQGVRVWHFFEERCAAFFALGRVMSTGRPVAVVTTSGTAAAELLPAVIEAHYQGRALVLVTADRPSRYRGSGAPQAIEQVGLFGGYALPTLDLEAGADAVWPAALSTRPLHVNVCLTEPLTGATAGVDFSIWEALGQDEAQRRATEQSQPVPDPFAPPNPSKSRRPKPATPSGRHPDAGFLEAYLEERRDLIVLASGLDPAEAALIAPRLAQLGVPIVAEATANLHAFPELQPLLVLGGEKALQALQPRRVLRVGGVPSWRWWRDLEERDDISVVHVSRVPFPGLARWEGVSVMPLPALADADLALPAAPQAQPKPSAQPWLSLQSALAAQPLSEPAWMRRLAAALPDGATVMLGNSLPIREWNLAAPDLAKRGVRVFANRGANGIDGLVSTFLGLSVEAAPAFLILGDLSAMYDLAAPWILRQMPPGDRRIVVINNGGGRIFSRVESLRALDDTARAVIENRHQQSFAPWAALWDLPYRLVEQPADLEALPSGPVILEVRPDSAQTDAFWAAR